MLSQSLIQSEISEVENKIKALDLIREQLEQDLLKIREDELELDAERMSPLAWFISASSPRNSRRHTGTLRIRTIKHQTPQSRHPPISPCPSFPEKKRYLFPALVPLPPSHPNRTCLSTLRARRSPSRHSIHGITHHLVFCFTAHSPSKTLEAHSTPITALDFSEPYGTLVSASLDDSQPRVWDLMTGSEIGRLRGHRGGVKCMQVEDNLCLTGSEDGSVRLWDLRLVDDDWEKDGLSDVPEEDSSSYHDGELIEKSDYARSSAASEADTESEGPCLRTFGGHSKAVTALYFEDECLVNAVCNHVRSQLC